jgi:hypothetical protein
VLALTRQISSVTPAAPTLEGNRLASPEMRTCPGGSATMSVVAGGAPVRKRYIWANVSGEVATCTWLWSGA